MNDSPRREVVPGALLSVVVPCFDEEAVIREAHRRLAAALETVPDLDFELVYVDDGSRDATLNLLRELQHADARVWILTLSRNFGHQMAVTAGLQCAAGDAPSSSTPISRTRPRPSPRSWSTGAAAPTACDGAVFATVAAAIRAGAAGEARCER